MNFKYYKTTPLIVVILLLSILIDKVVVDWLIPLLENILNLQNFRAPTTTSLIAGVLLLYNHVLWKYPVFNLLVKTPDINGRYEGKIQYEFNGVKGEKDCAIEVIQNASKIKVHSYFNNGNSEKTSSKSLVEDIQRDEDGFFDIYLFYLNSGTKANNSLDCHEGANKLRFIPKRNGTESKLTGHYFTNRKEQTKGEIEAYFKSKELKGEF